MTAKRDARPVKWDYYEVPASDVNPFEIYSWCPTPKPTVPPTQVHLHLPPIGHGRGVIRFKSPRTLDQLIAALQEHRRDVWGEPTEEDLERAKGLLRTIEGDK